MKRSTLLTFILILATLANGQVNSDSLQKVINSGRPYAEKINASIRLLQDLETKNFDATIQEGEKALALARKNNDSIAVAEVKRHIGVASYFKGEYNVAARNYFESIAILENSNRPEKLAPVYNELAKLYRKTRDLDKAAENYNKAENIFRQLKDCFIFS